MKKMVVTVCALFLVTGLSACATAKTPLSRDRLMANINLILMVEQRDYKVRTNIQLLDMIGEIPPDKAEELKSLYDVYYVHYLAASVKLAEGNIAGYKAQLKLAERELDAMEALLAETETPKKRREPETPATRPPKPNPNMF